jgi:hypothetical protein
MTDEEYRDILQSTREWLKQVGFGGIDERLMLSFRESRGPFHDLIRYLEALAEEIALGSDVQLANVLRRLRQHVQTESGGAVEGIRVLMSDNERRLYQESQIDFALDPSLSEVVRDIREVITDLEVERRNRPDPDHRTNFE